MSTPLIEELRILAADVLGVPRSQLGEETSPQQVDNWDSLQQVNLVVAIEEQFGVEFDPDEISHMESIGRIAEILSRKVSER